MLSRIATRFGAVLVAIILIGGLGSQAAAEKIIRFGFSDGLDTPHGQTMQIFEKHVEKGSNGEIQVQLFPGLQLGPVVEELEGVKLGTQEMFLSTPAWFSRFDSRVDVLSLPFLATNWEEAERILSSDVLRQLADQAEEASGIKILGITPLGFRNMMNKVRPIEQVEDFSDIKIRVQNSPVYLSMFRALGANPVALDAGEIYQAVESGVVDGLETTLPIMLSSKFYQVAPKISQTRHTFEVLLIYMNPDFYNTLTPEEQAVVDGAMRAAETASLVIVKTAEEQAIRGLVAAGAQVNEVSDAAIKDLQSRMQPLYEEFGPKFGGTLEKLRSVTAGE